MPPGLTAGMPGTAERTGEQCLGRRCPGRGTDPSTLNPPWIGRQSLGAIRSSGRLVHRPPPWGQGPQACGPHSQRVMTSPEPQPQPQPRPPVSVVNTVEFWGGRSLSVTVSATVQLRGGGRGAALGGRKPLRGRARGTLHVWNNGRGLRAHSMSIVCDRRPLYTQTLKPGLSR
jgi:hypothetical protein